MFTYRRVPSKNPPGSGPGEGSSLQDRLNVNKMARPVSLVSGEW